MDATKRISDLIVISQRLADLLARENKALRDHKAHEVQGFLEQKVELSQAYESRISGLGEHASAEAMAGVDPALREQVRALGERIQSLSSDNTMLLQVAMEVNRRVLHEVADALKSANGQTGYTRDGTLGYRPGHGNPHSISVSLDKSL